MLHVIDLHYNEFLTKTPVAAVSAGVLYFRRSLINEMK